MMISTDQILVLLRVNCECTKKIRIKCPNCLIIEAVTNLTDQIDELTNNQDDLNEKIKLLNKGIREVKVSHNVHIEALQHYYHKIHKDCPCQTVKKGECKSPWSTIAVEELPPKMSRDTELEMVDDFIRRRNAITDN